MRGGPARSDAGRGVSPGRPASNVVSAERPVYRADPDVRVGYFHDCGSSTLQDRILSVCLPFLLVLHRACFRRRGHEGLWIDNITVNL